MRWPDWLRKRTVKTVRTRPFDEDALPETAAPTLDHARDHRAHDMERGPEVLLEHLPELRRIDVGDLCAARVATDQMEQDIDRA